MVEGVWVLVVKGVGDEVCVIVCLNLSYMKVLCYWFLCVVIKLF